MTKSHSPSVDKKVKQDKELQEKRTTEVISNLLAERKKDGEASKVDKFCLYMAFDLPIETCARLSGCSMSYAYKLHAKYSKDTKSLVDRISEFAGKAPDAYVTLTKLKLPLIAQIDDLGLQEYRSNPKMILEKPGHLRQLKNTAGVIQDEGARPHMVNIESLVIAQNYLSQQQDEVLKKIKGDVVDAEAKELPGSGDKAE